MVEPPPKANVRDVLEVMYASARDGGGALPSTDLDSPEQLMAAWEQYRESYGGNGLASGGGAAIEDARQATEVAVSHGIVVPIAAVRAAGAAQAERPGMGTPAGVRAEASEAHAEGTEAGGSEHSTAAVSQKALEHALFHLV
mmetsp:Transcript_6708/g.17503  ORF Transcript_6708/g.17503 Transcript_6708/m.17503 type:complete len:142 (+) Transcript_6708:58-483(+)